MKVQNYQFGKITVDGKEYTSDLKIICGQIYPNWWRKEGHFLQVDDIQDVVNKRPEIFIIGTGAAGVMRIDRKVLDELSNLGIEVIAKKSSEAVKIFNELLKEKGPDKIALAIHLTC